MHSKHKSPLNGLTDYLRGFVGRSPAGSQRGNVNDVAKVVILLYFSDALETTDMINIFQLISDRGTLSFNYPLDWIL